MPRADRMKKTIIKRPRSFTTRPTSASHSVLSKIESASCESTMISRMRPLLHNTVFKWKRYGTVPCWYSVYTETLWKRHKMKMLSENSMNENGIVLTKGGITCQNGVRDIWDFQKSLKSGAIFGFVPQFPRILRIFRDFHTWIYIHTY